MSDPQVVRPAEVLGVERPDDDFHQSAHKALCNQHDAALIRIAELERERDEAVRLLWTWRSKTLSLLPPPLSATNTLLAKYPHLQQDDL
jgi:hypothetical protein